MLILLIALANSVLPALGQNRRSGASDPDDARLITADIQNFWRAYDQATPQNQVQVFEREYLGRGSAGLKDFVLLRIRDAATLVKTINAYHRYYDSIRASTQRVEEMRLRIKASFYALKYLYPDAVFPDVYFMIGRMSSGGTTSASGLLIGTEIFSRTAGADESMLSDWHKQVLRPIEYLPNIVAHELIHYQQEYPLQFKLRSTLLSSSIEEGCADFLAELISGAHSNQHLHAWGNPRELQIWEEFKREMNGSDVSKWLYNGANAKDRPADLGYYVGYKIAESYYTAAQDKKQAVKAILEIKDFAQFLKDSGYEAKFNKSAN